MKYTLIALLAAAGVSAQSSSAAQATPVPSATQGAGDSSCQAEYIVSQCLTTEQAKAAACSATDYKCQCAAYQAIATCYNNCPGDPRASSAQNQVIVFCQQASIENAATASKTSSASGSASASQISQSAQVTPTPSPTVHNNAASSSFVTGNPTSTGSAAELVRNTGGALFAMAGVIAAMF